MTTLSFDHQDIMNLIVLNLEKNIKNGLFLETETGKMIFADIFTTSQQLFLVPFKINTFVLMRVLTIYTSI